MARALQDQMTMPTDTELSFEERLGLLVDREATERDSRRLTMRLKLARLRQTASPEDVDFRHPRGLDRTQFLALTSCRWIKDRDNCLLTGPTGVGKTYLACALAHIACREGYSVLYVRTPRLLSELGTGRLDGSYPKRLRALDRCELLVLDDWASNRSPTRAGAISWKYWMIATTDAQHCSPHKCPSNIGMSTSAIRHSPTPFWTGLCITPTRSL